MNKSMIVGVLLGAVGVTAVGALATYQWIGNRTPEFATVLDVKPVKETQRIPREVCRDVTVTHQRPVQDQHQLAGTAIGAVVGGLLGNQVGGGSGNKLAAVVGAVGGGYAGNKAQERMQGNDTYTTTETRCETVHDTHEHVIGYDVRYELSGQQGTVRMASAPGPRLPVRDGQLVLDEQQQ